MTFVPVARPAMGRDPKITKELMSKTTLGFGEVQVRQYGGGGMVAGVWRSGGG